MNPAEYAFTNNLIVDPQKCVFCGICLERCPLDNIRLELAPCRRACPIGQNCHAYIRQIVRGQKDLAMKTILETLPMPGVLGRICSHPCESACLRTQVDDQPVAIRALKRFLADNLTRALPELPTEQRDELVAVVGSGPAGLTAAWDLRRLGYRVTIYEKATGPGGNLTGVIPEFRLPVEIVMKEIDWLLSWGIELKTGTAVGKDISLEELTKENHAILVASGAGKSIKLNLPGEEATNVYSGLEFLAAAKENRVPLLGRSAVVIGGGNTAVDAAQTAGRLGVKEVKIVCLERLDEMPAYPWEVTQALEEGITIDVGWGPSSFKVEGDRAKSLTCHRCLSIWKNGQFSPSFDRDTCKSFAADSFIVAIGDRPNGEILSSLGLIKSPAVELRVDPLTLETALQGVFVAGDAATGPTSVVDAMASGRKAAISIDRYISGEDLRYGRSYPGPYLFDFHVDLSAGNKTPRQTMPALSPTNRRDFSEIEQGFDERAAGDGSRTLSLLWGACGLFRCLLVLLAL
jgi:NADPH-dependent glutamate synthase beta subunit-like oxidoreductase